MWSIIMGFIALTCIEIIFWQSFTNTWTFHVLQNMLVIATRVDQSISVQNAHITWFSNVFLIAEVKI